MSTYLLLFKEIMAIVVPLIKEIARAVKEQREAGIQQRQISAKTSEEKRDVAREIANYLYRY